MLPKNITLAEVIIVMIIVLTDIMKKITIDIMIMMAVTHIVIRLQY